MRKNILYYMVDKRYIISCFACLLFVFSCTFFSFPVLFARPARDRAYTKHFKKNPVRAGAMKLPSSPAPATPVAEVKPAESAALKVDENALNEAKSVRNFRNAELSRLKAELASLQSEMKKSGTCTVDGRQITVTQYRAKISSLKAFSKTDKVAKINAEISDKRNVIAELEKRVGEKEATAKKMVAGTVATSTLALAGTAGLGVAIADLVKTKMSQKKLQDGKKVCGKYGLLVK